MSEKLPAATSASNEEPLRQQASAWMAVAELLNELSPGWSLTNGGSGTDMALAAIRKLSTAVSAPSRARLLARACDAAFAFIDSHAADPDLTSEMCIKHAAYLEARRELEGTP